jgi:hypothetical protein
MAGEIDVFEPEVHPADVQARRNRDLDAGTLAKVVENFTAAYKETYAIAAEYWARQGTKGAAQLARFGLWKTVILTAYGDELPEELAWVATAGAELHVANDGTVSVKA